MENIKTFEQLDFRIYTKEIADALHQLKKGKASGLDEMLKAGGTILTPLLHMAKSCSLFYSWDMNIHDVVEPRDIFFQQLWEEYYFFRKKNIAYDFIVMFPLNAPHIIIWSRDTLFMKKRCKWYRRIVWKCLGIMVRFTRPTSLRCLLNGVGHWKV